MEVFIPARCKIAKVHRKKHTPENIVQSLYSFKHYVNLAVRVKNYVSFQVLFFLFNVYMNFEVASCHEGDLLESARGVLVLLDCLPILVPLKWKFSYLLGASSPKLPHPKYNSCPIEIRGVLDLLNFIPIHVRLD